MCWLKRLFGSGTKEPAPRYQFDLRDEAEKDMERAAHQSLGGEDEKIAQTLYRLCVQADPQYTSDRAAWERTRAEIRKIGEQLCSNGGSKRMGRIAYRVAILRGDNMPAAHTTEMEGYWVGICGWQL